MHKTLANPLRLTTRQVGEMRRDGVIVLKNFISQAGLELLSAASSDLEIPPDEQERRRFSRLGYGTGAPQRAVKAFCRTDAFVRVLELLIGRNKVVTNLLSFDLGKGSKGEPWHFGGRSFCFIDPDVPAYTLWIPLTPIRPKTHGGGLAWVPESQFSAYSRVQQWTLVMRGLGEGSRNIALARARVKQFNVDGVPWAGQFDIYLLEQLKVERDFDVGDALLFSRNVWHRTSPMRDSASEIRKAVVMRFVDGAARIDKSITAGLASELRPEPEAFVKMLFDSDESLPIGEQPFSTPLAV